MVTCELGRIDFGNPPNPRKRSWMNERKQRIKKVGKKNDLFQILAYVLQKNELFFRDPCQNKSCSRSSSMNKPTLFVPQYHIGTWLHLILLNDAMGIIKAHMIKTQGLFTCMIAHNML